MNPTVTRRSVLLALSACAAGSRAQGPAAYPSKSIALVVALQAGSASDVASRVVAEALSRRLGQPLVVENLPGAGGVVGASRLHQARPDGHVLGALNNGLVCLVPNLSKPSFDIGTLTSIGMIADLPSVLVASPAIPAQTLPELVAYSKKNAGKLSYGSVGLGSPQHVAMEMLKNETGLDMLHVPYRGGPQAVADVVAGQIAATWIAISVAAPFIKSRQLRPIAVGGQQREALLPNVQTLAEAGVRGFDYLPWLGFYGPPDLPRAITTRLNAEIQDILREPAVGERFAAAGLRPAPMDVAASEQRGIVERREMAAVLKRLKLA